MQHELAALGGSDRRRDRDLAAELIGSPRLAAADAFDLWRVQRIDLRPTLALFLIADAQREIEQRAKALFECWVARDLAADVADDAAKPCAQEFELPPGALELVCMDVAPHHDGGTLGHAPIALAQLNAFVFGQIDQLLDCAMGEPRIGRMCDRLFLHGGVHHDPLEILGLDRLRLVRHREALLQQCGELLFTQPLTPTGERRAIKRQLVSEHHFPTEVLVIRVLYPAIAQLLVGEVVRMLEDEQPGDQPRRQRRLPRPHATDRAEASRHKVPIDLPGEYNQRMAGIDELLQRQLKQVVLTIVARLAHGLPSTANLAVEGIMSSQSRESQNARKPTPAPGFLAKSNTCSDQISPINQALRDSSRTTL